MILIEILLVVGFVTVMALAVNTAYRLGRKFRQDEDKKL